MLRPRPLLQECLRRLHGRKELSPVIFLVQYVWDRWGEDYAGSTVVYRGRVGIEGFVGEFSGTSTTRLVSKISFAYKKTYKIENKY